MVSRATLYAQLDRLESELRERLLPHLEDAAKGNNELVFCVSDFNPFPHLQSRTDPETEALVMLGRQILAMKAKLGESADGIVAERLCWYCRQWGEVKARHRKAAEGLAKEFLGEIVNADG